MSMYHRGSRKLQDLFDTRLLADRLEMAKKHVTFTEEDRDFIKRSAMFFLATADTEGHPECSYKGGLPGFVQVVNKNTLVFPDYDGNGMFKSLGNILLNPYVGLLFIDFEHPSRLRINGIATIYDDDPLLDRYVGAQLLVRVQATQIFPNCPRYIHQMQLINHSLYVPRFAYTPPMPEWKKNPLYRSALPKAQKLRRRITAVTKVMFSHPPPDKEDS